MTKEEILELIPNGTGKVYKFLEEIPEGVKPSIHMTIALVEALNDPDVISATVVVPDQQEYFIYTFEAVDLQDDRFEYLCDMIAATEDTPTDTEVPVDSQVQEG